MYSVYAAGTRLVPLVALGVAALLACSFHWMPMGPRRTALIAGAKPVGPDECVVCHNTVQSHELIASYHADCEACHGGGSPHIETEKVADIRHPSADDCLACHASGYSTHLQWGTGDHARAGLICSDCHNPHATTRRHLREFSTVGFGQVDEKSRLCLECHPEIGSQLRFPSHHPVLEGALGCLSCHDPHEDRRVAFGGVNQQCFGCHQDYAGPWIYEHAPVAEDCTICHNPHGAVTKNLLETIQPVLCLSCHSLNDMWHHAFTGTGLPNATITGDYPTGGTEQITSAEARPFLRQCSNCHGAIHGSYTDEHLRH